MGGCWGKTAPGNKSKLRRVGETGGKGKTQQSKGEAKKNTHKKKKKKKKGERARKREVLMEVNDMRSEDVRGMLVR